MSTVTAINDPINPNHYKGVLVIPRDKLPTHLDEEGNLTLEYIDVMQFVMTHEEFVGHLKGQAFKYLLRLGKKDNSVQELNKSNWYISRLANYLKSFVKKVS